MLVLDGGDLFLRGEFEQLKDYQRTLNFPFLCGNSVHEETGTLLPLETAASPARGPSLLRGLGVLVEFGDVGGEDVLAQRVDLLLERLAL